MPMRVTASIRAPEPRTASPSARAGATDMRMIYHFGRTKTEGNASQRDLLGGNGANLAEMTNLGLPVPSGFTITTEACNAFIAAGNSLPDGLLDQVRTALKQVEDDTGKTLGDPKNPLLVSVRSGAKFSMPGMMDTILDLGLNDKTLEGLIAKTGDPRFGYDSWRRFIMMFGDVVLEIDRAKFDEIFEEAKERAGIDSDADMPAEALKDVADRSRALVMSETGSEFPDDPMQQLELAVSAVFGSWNNARAVHYRRIEDIPDDLGTAVTIQTMVFGNMGDDSGSGVATAEQLQGKELSDTNLSDTDAAFELVAEFEGPAIAIIKHANPCGAAVGRWQVV